MDHLHAHAHLHRRQRQQQQQDPNQDPNEFVATIISIEIVTPTRAPARVTVQVPPNQTLIQPAVRSRPSTDQDQNDDQPQGTPAPSKRPSSGAQPVPKTASTLMLATKAPVPSAAATAGFASSTALAAGGAAQGMSTAAKAGLALGILVVIGALLIGVLLVYKRKQAKAAAERENEKNDLWGAPPPPPPQVAAMDHHSGASIRSERTMSTAPRLSLRPVTQFDPAFHEQRRSGGNLLNVAAAGGAHNRDRELPDRPSAWERPGAQNSSPSNPFNDPATNPFGNNAAVDARHAHIPDSPPNASPLHADPLAMRSTSPPSGELPLPPNQGRPVSPAWTEDFPAAPGPAPAGPPPMVGGMAGPPPAPNNVHRIQLDFKASMADELNLQAGQLVRMLHEYDDGWALCTRMDRSQQGVVPRTCLSKYPVKPRGPPRQGPPPPGMRGPPVRPQMGPGGNAGPRPLSPNGRMSPHPQGFNGPPTTQRSMSPAPRAMAPNPPMQGAPRARSNSNAPYAQPQRSMSPSPYGGGPQMAPPSMDTRRRSNSLGPSQQRRGPPSGALPVPARKPVPGMAI